MPKFTVPVATLFTLIRLIISPLILPMLMVYILPMDIFYLNLLLAVGFVALSFTDFLDGYYSRKYNQTTQLGAALDHIADKFLTTSTLIALLAVDKIYFFWVIIFIGRDLFIMGLRMIALEHNFSVPVGYTGKIKTACMMVFITFLIAMPYPDNHRADLWQKIELILLTGSLILTVLSGYTYFRIFMQYFPHHDAIEQS